VLARSPKFGLEPIGFVSDDPQEWGREVYECSYQRKSPARVLPGQPSPQLLQELGVSVLVVATRDLSQDAILRWVAQFSAHGISVYFAPAEFFESGVRIEYAEIDGILLGHASGENTRAVYETGKRLLDMGLSATLLVLFAPLLIVLAVLVKVSSPGPVIFRQNRIGKDGKTFPMLKFRSMVVDAPLYAFSPTEDEDPRITTIGRFLRRTSLDELPQIMNVLAGHMSFVGPRPEMPFIADQHSSILRERLKVKPGITGLWQLSADRAFLIHENIEYDLYYVRHRSLFMDVAILLHTLVFAGRGV
jgi:exopolysaccharide biosynthesis polyprenyl glycosylphosphotransferase